MSTTQRYNNQEASFNSDATTTMLGLCLSSSNPYQGTAFKVAAKLLGLRSYEVNILKPPHMRSVTLGLSKPGSLSKWREV